MLKMRCIIAVSAGLLTASLSSSKASAEPDCGLYQYKAQIVRVVDGDTVRADIDLGFNTWRRNEPLRLIGIDAPEPRGQSKIAGKASTQALVSRIEGKEVTICTIKDKTGKFGRYLVEIFLGRENINQWMVKSGHAVPYQ